MKNYGGRKSIEDLRRWEELVILNRMVRICRVGKLKFEQKL